MPFMQITSTASHFSTKISILLQANKKRNTNKSNKGGQKPQGHALTVKTDNGYVAAALYFPFSFNLKIYFMCRDVPVTEVLLDEEDTGSVAGKKEECTKSIDHKGQGDGPCTVVEEAATSN